MQLDVVVDVVCPWCFVGKRQLDKALTARPDMITDISYRPYQLGPNTPKEGIDRDTYYLEKFGDTPEYRQNRAHMVETGKTLGINFNYEDPVLIGNTLDAHRLIRWAQSTGRQRELVDDLMQAYFERAEFLGDKQVLLNAAGKIDMDVSLVSDLLDSDRDAAAVSSEAAQWQQLGVSGVPCFIFNKKHAVVGAQSADVLVNAMDKIATLDG